jgi:hypothetical protein
VDDKINYAFSLAFTTSPDGIPQPAIGRWAYQAKKEEQEQINVGLFVNEN